MAYTSLIELKKYMPATIIQQLTDDHGAGQIAVEIVTDAISQAEKMIDGFLRGRYPAEIATDDVPDLIQDIATKLTAYNLYRRKLQTTLPEAISKDYKFCLETLKRIQDGKLTPFESVSEPAVILTNKTSDDRTYTPAVWATYQ